MKLIPSVAAGLLLAGIVWAPAQAQGLPQGSYLRTCDNAGVRGDALIATCHRVDGREQRTTLAAVNRCVGDISNNNGNLQCDNRRGVPPPRAVQPHPVPVPVPVPVPGPLLSQWQGPGYAQEWPGRREHCERMRDRFQELRIRFDYAPPWERERAAPQLLNLRERLRHECWGHWREE